MKPGPPPLDAARAAWWRSKGLTWPAVGRVLAREDNRAVPYHGAAVSRVVYAHLAAQA